MASTLPRHSFPGHLTDMSSELEQQWSDNYISTWMNQEITGKVEGPYNGRTPLSQFFDGMKTAYNQSQPGFQVQWSAFPARIQAFYTKDSTLRWRIADSSRILQDEYLEWSVLRQSLSKKGLDPTTDPVIYVSMTGEGPEYWQFMGDKDFDKLTNLYQTLHANVPGVKIDPKDLILGDGDKVKVYDPRNIWNYTTTSGTIAHLIQPSNTLSAEIDIVAQATVIREKDGKIITGASQASQLLQCSQYGNDYRNSDPTIGIQVNGLAVGSNIQPAQDVSIADPVALYIISFSYENFQLDYNGAKNTQTNQGTPDRRSVPDGVFRFPRGALPMALRIEISIPEGVKSNDGVQLTVSDLYDTTTGAYVQYGAQFADHIFMGVKAVGIDGTAAKAQPCPAPPAAAKPLPLRLSSLSKPQVVSGRKGGI